MTLILLSIIAVILFIISFKIPKTANAQESKLIILGLRIGAGALVLLGGFISCVKIIDVGEVGVQKIFGSVQSTHLSSGLHFINPFADVVTLDIRTQNYTMSAKSTEGKEQGDDAIRVLTADGLEVVIDLSVLYRVASPDAPNIIKTIGEDYEDKIIRPVSRTRIRDNAVYYNAVDLYSVKKVEFQNKIDKALREDFANRGIILESILIRNIDLPASIKTSIEQKIHAEQEAQKMEYVLQKEKQEAERKRVEAQGIADYQKIIQSTLTEQQIQYKQIESNLKLAESQNAKVIIYGNGKPNLLINQ